MLKTRKALVTGVRSGLGKAVTTLLLAEGLEVWGTSRDPKSLKAAKLKWGNKFHPLRLDLSKTEEIQDFGSRFLESVPDCDLLINNAGGGAFYPFEKIPDAILENQVQSLMLNQIRLTRSLYEHFLKAGTGTIVNVSSLAARFPIPGMSVYSASKAGLSAFSEGLMIESEIHGVVIIDFQLGDCQTEFNRSVVRDEADRDPRSVALWKRLENNLANGIKPEVAAQKLVDSVRRGKSRVITCGNWFQSVAAPFLVRFAPCSVKHGFLRKYFE